MSADELDLAVFLCGVPTINDDEPDGDEYDIDPDFYDLEDGDGDDDNGNMDFEEEDL